MTISEILKTVDLFGKKAGQERKGSPQIIQNTKAVRHPDSSGIHKAYCKTDAGSGSTLACYLDEDLEEPPQDPPPTEITVNFPNISPSGTNLNACIRRLKDGDSIAVYLKSGSWYCLEGFQKIDSDQLQVDATNGLQTTLPECP